MWNRLFKEMQPVFWFRLNNCFLRKCWIISIQRCFHISWENNYSIWAKNLVTSLDRNASTFLEETIIQSLPIFWLHLYIEMIPDFLRNWRIQCFNINMRFFSQCNLYGINSISVIDAPLWFGILLCCESYWGVSDNSKCYPGLFYLLFYQNGRLVNTIHGSEGFAHFMLWEPFYYRKHGWVSFFNPCPIVPRSDFQSA